MGKSTINGPFSIAMLNYQRVSPFHGKMTSPCMTQSTQAIYPACRPVVRQVLPVQRCCRRWQVPVHAMPWQCPMEMRYPNLGWLKSFISFMYTMYIYMYIYIHIYNIICMRYVCTTDHPHPHHHHLMDLFEYVTTKMRRNSLGVSHYIPIWRAFFVSTTHLPSRIRSWCQSSQITLW